LCVARNIAQLHSVFKNQNIAHLKGAIEWTMLEGVSKKKKKVRKIYSANLVYVNHIGEMTVGYPLIYFFPGKTENLMFFGSEYL